MRFLDYGPAELEQCAEELCRWLDQLAQKPKVPTEAWTEFVLDWLASTAGRDVLVDARKVRRRPRWNRFLPELWNIKPRCCFGEFGLDLVHSNYQKYEPSGRYFDDDYCERTLRRGSQPLEVLLAVECEWGREGSRPATRREVFVDAVKLTACRARAKIMIFGCHQETREGLLTDLELLRERTDDRTPWLLIDVPWDLPPSGHYASTPTVLTGRSRRRSMSL